MVKTFAHKYGMLIDEETGDPVKGYRHFVEYSDYATLKAENERLKLSASAWEDSARINKARADDAERALAERAGGLKEAFKLGFFASAEGFNGEYPFEGEIPNDARGRKWVEMRDRILSALDPSAPEARQEAVEELAAFLCSEFDFDLDPVVGASWPEHKNDDGYRGKGYVRLQPSDVQARARENASRILAFVSQLTRPAEQAVTEAMVSAALKAHASAYWSTANDGEGAAKRMRAALEAALAQETGR